MKNLSELILEKMYETDTWLYIFLPTYEKNGHNWFLGNSSDVSFNTDYTKYVKVKTKKNISGDDSLSKKQWIKKYPDENIPPHFTLWMCSLGDLEVEKIMNEILKLVDKGKVSFNQLQNDFESDKVNHPNENPDYLKKIVNKYK